MNLRGLKIGQSLILAATFEVGDVVRCVFNGKLRPGKILKLHKDKADVDFGPGEVYTIYFKQMRFISRDAGERAA